MTNQATLVVYVRSIWKACKVNLLPCADSTWFNGLLFCSLRYHQCIFTLHDIYLTSLPFCKLSLNFLNHCLFKAQSRFRQTLLKRGRGVVHEDNVQLYQCLDHHLCLLLPMGGRFLCQFIIAIMIIIAFFKGNRWIPNVVYGCEEMFQKIFTSGNQETQAKSGNKESDWARIRENSQIRELNVI